MVGNEVKLDLTGDTVTPAVMMSGTTAHDRSGAPITGTLTIDDHLDANSANPVQNNVVTAALAGKQSSIAQSALLTLTVSGWDSQTMQQTVTFAHDTTKRNVIDITPSEVPEWSAAGVYASAETSAGITFTCATVPETALTFKVTSMEVS